MSARWTSEPDWDRLVAEHRHGAWCHPAAEGCPDLMRPMTPTQAVTRGRPTRLRSARPPLIGDVAWWLIFIAAFLLVLLCL